MMGVEAWMSSGSCPAKGEIESVSVSDALIGPVVGIVSVSLAGLSVGWCSSVSGGEFVIVILRSSVCSGVDQVRLANAFTCCHFVWGLAAAEFEYVSVMGF